MYKPKVGDWYYRRFLKGFQIGVYTKVEGNRTEGSRFEKVYDNIEEVRKLVYEHNGWKYKPLEG